MAKENHGEKTTLKSKVHWEFLEKEQSELTFKPKINKTVDNEN